MPKITLEIPDRRPGGGFGWWPIHRLRLHAQELRELSHERGLSPGPLPPIWEEVETAAAVLEAVLRVQRGPLFDAWVASQKHRNGELENEIRARAATMGERLWSWLTAGVMHATHADLERGHR